MRILVIGALLLTAGAQNALAQTTVPPRPTAGLSQGPSKTAAKNEYDAAVTNCVQMWDRGTHMTGSQWLRTCRRVQTRLQNMQLK